ncbi:M56 family metallopeptidase [Stieleria magnilauensis]
MWNVLVVAAVTIWAMIIAIHLQRIARDWWAIERLRRKGRPVTSGTLSRLHAEVASNLGLQRSVQLLLVKGRQSPIVSGYFRPFILVGEAALAGLDEGQIRALLAHEQSHVRRLDPCWNLLLEVARGVFSFQPLNHWAAREIRVQAEFAADRSARSVQDALDLARCLQNFAQQRGKSEWMLAIGMAGPRSNFAHRVVRLLDADGASAPDRRIGWAIRIAGACFALGLVLTGPGLHADSTSTAQQSAKVATKVSKHTNDGFPADAVGFVGVVEGVLLEKIDRDNLLFEVRSVEELARDKNMAIIPSSIVGQQIRVRLIPSQRVRRFRRHVGDTPNGGSMRMTIQHTDQSKFDLHFVTSPKRYKSRLPENLK